MSPVDTTERETMFVQVDHAFCRGTGKVTRELRQVIASQEEQHKKHTYRTTKDIEEGETCNCKWITKRVQADCVGCGGHGYQHATLIIPNKGDKVKVRSQALLVQLFGDEDPPEVPGTVFEVQGPGEHNLELPNGLAVQVTWDRLLSGVKFTKKGGTTWAFDISEIKVVT